MVNSLKGFQLKISWISPIQLGHLFELPEVIHLKSFRYLSLCSIRRIKIILGRDSFNYTSTHRKKPKQCKSSAPWARNFEPFQDLRVQNNLESCPGDKNDRLVINTDWNRYLSCCSFSSFGFDKQSLL